MKSTSLVHAILTLWLPLIEATGFRTVGSSGVAAQMVFTPPNTTTVVFVDNYHENHGGPGVNLTTGAHSATSWVYDDGSGIYVFGAEYNLQTNGLRKLRPRSNTFCSAGTFFADGTLLNIAGAEPGPTGVDEGFDKIRTYAPGPCNGDCAHDWVEQAQTLQHRRWYPTAQTLVDGSVLVVGGSDVGGLVLNEASINVPTYEIIYQDGRKPPPAALLPILDFTDADNLVPGKSYNLYPMLHLLPNPSVANQILTGAGNRTVVWDYTQNVLVKTLPDTPRQPRTFPSSATTVLLPLLAPKYSPTVLVCGGSSGDMPNTLALNDCYTINPQDDSPIWTPTDNLPNGPQTMSDGILLPDGTVLILNGGGIGSGGGYMADKPVFQPVIYNSTAPAGAKFTTMPGTQIPRLYHSIATLLPSGEVLVAGSNPNVFYTTTGNVPSGWPYFNNNGHQCALQQQQFKTSSYPTEYRVELFSPPYLSAPTPRPLITSLPPTLSYNTSFQLRAEIAPGSPLLGQVQISLLAPGFHTHGVAMGQRMVMLGFEASANAVIEEASATPAVVNSTAFTVAAPRDASVMPPGVYLFFVVYEGVPSEGMWVKVGA